MSKQTRISADRANIVIEKMHLALLDAGLTGEDAVSIYYTAFIDVYLRSFESEVQIKKAWYCMGLEAVKTWKQYKEKQKESENE